MKTCSLLWLSRQFPAKNAFSAFPACLKNNRFEVLVLKSCPQDLSIFAEAFPIENELQYSTVSSGLQIFPGKQSHEDRASRVLTQVLESYVNEWLRDAEYNGQSKKTIQNKREHIAKLLWFLKRENLT